MTFHKTLLLFVLTVAAIKFASTPDFDPPPGAYGKDFPLRILTGMPAVICYDTDDKHPRTDGKNACAVGILYKNPIFVEKGAPPLP